MRDERSGMGKLSGVKMKSLVLKAPHKNMSARTEGAQCGLPTRVVMPHCSNACE